MIPNWSKWVGDRARQLGELLGVAGLVVAVLVLAGLVALGVVMLVRWRR